jgi:hypothetical protein
MSREKEKIARDIIHMYEFKSFLAPLPKISLLPSFEVKV